LSLVVEKLRMILMVVEAACYAGATAPSPAQDQDITSQPRSTKEVRANARRVKKKKPKV
jgi:hypothetical protein